MSISKKIIPIILFSTLAATVSVVILIYLLEFILLLNERFYVKQRSFETKNEYLFNNSKNSNIEIYPAYHINLANNDFFPLGTIPNSLNLLCNESGNWSIFKSDRYGFNNPDFVITPPAKTNAWELQKHILLIGDSYVQGACVDQDNSISFQMIELGRTNTINLSNSGMGPLSQLAMIMEYAPLTNPTDIFWFYYEGNDLIDLKLEYKNPILRNYFLQGSIQFLRQPEKQNKIKKFYENYLEKQKTIKKKNSYINFLKIQRLKNFVGICKNIYLPINKETKTLFQSALNRFKFFAEQLDSNLYFVYIPSFHRYSTTDFLKFDKFSKEKIISIVKKNNIKLIDIDEKLLTKKNFREFYPNGQFGHFNEIGYYEIAKIINDYVN